jgi:hypothetical protein
MKEIAAFAAIIFLGIISIFGLFWPDNRFKGKTKWGALVMLALIAVSTVFSYADKTESRDTEKRSINIIQSLKDSNYILKVQMSSLYQLIDKSGTAQLIKTDSGITVLKKNDSLNKRIYAEQPFMQFTSLNCRFDPQTTKLGYALTYTNYTPFLLRNLKMKVVYFLSSNGNLMDIYHAYKESILDGGSHGRLSSFTASSDDIVVGARLDTFFIHASLLYNNNDLVPQRRVDEYFYWDFQKQQAFAVNSDMMPRLRAVEKNNGLF